MYLICFGTRPELIKLIPLIYKFEEKKVEFKTLFSGQHETLIKDLYKYIRNPDYTLQNVMQNGQSLNELTSKIMIESHKLFSKQSFSHIIVQGDTTTACSLALSAFHFKIKVIHLEAGLRTNDKYSPFPEEINRKIISQISDVHLCPTQSAYNNLVNENIKNNIFVTGNTIVDMYDFIMKNTKPSLFIDNIIKENKKYYIVTLHRRENRGNNMSSMWNQLNKLSSTYKFIYIKHPSLPESESILNSNIRILEPQDYQNMVHLISNSVGIITDSGGLQEEAVCAMKRVLICRDTTERPETIECGLGKLIGTEISSNMYFLDQDIQKIIDNPYGINVSENVFKHINKKYNS